jgi:hypothetical protein
MGKNISALNMTTTIGTNGRFCNHFIRNICISMIARKFDLITTYSYEDEMKSLGIQLYSGSKKYARNIYVNDINFLHYLNIERSVNENFILKAHTYFQTREISNVLHRYLQFPEIRDPIIRANKFSDRYNTNNDIFIHIRLGDVSLYNPGFAYYDKAIQMLAYKKPSYVYISSDTIDHPICTMLISKYSAKIINYDYIDTLKFASTCKYLILSHGSFSATIGNLGFYSEVYYPRYDPRKIWFGDMFTGNGWNEIGY